VIFIALTLLNPNTAMEVLHHPPLSTEEPLNSKTTFLVKYISGKADLVGKIAAYIFVSDEL
jgi:hypothetical protein